MTLTHLRGRVVPVEFWTSECSNCVHVIPHVKQWHERYKDAGLVVDGVHAPEYDNERGTGNVEEAVMRFGIAYPVAQDNDYKTWMPTRTGSGRLSTYLTRTAGLSIAISVKATTKGTEAQIKRLLGIG